MSFTLAIKTAKDLVTEARARAEARIATAIDAHVESQARALGYNSAVACAGYRDSTIPAWADEARAFIAWRDRVWEKAFVLQALHAADEVPPEVESILSALPEFGA